MRGDDLDTRRRRAAYRAGHRGTKEMDWLLGRYADAKLPDMDGERLDQFERFLALPDPELHRWIVNPQTIEGREFADLVSAVRRFHALD
jgi:antitoxin CptB